MVPTTIEMLALAVCAGAFQETTPVFVTTVPFASAGLITARNWSTTTPPGARSPLTAA